MIDILSIMLFSILALKIVSIMNAIRWLTREGRNYLSSVQEKQPQTYEEYFQLFKDNKGGFFPFGFKDFRLRQFAIDLENKNKWYLKPVHRLTIIFQSRFYRFEALTVIIVAYVSIITPLCKLNIFTTSFIPVSWNCWLLCAIAILLIFANLALSVEAAFSFGILGSYATYFHMQTTKTNLWSGGSQFLLELRVLVGKLFTTILASTLSFYVAHIFFDSLTGSGMASFDGLNPLSWLVIFFQSAYFSLTTLLTVGYGDIYPKNILGQFVSFLVQLQSFALLGIVFTSLVSVVSPEKERGATRKNSENA